MSVSWTAGQGSVCLSWTAGRGSVCLCAGLLDGDL